MLELENPRFSLCSHLTNDDPAVPLHRFFIKQDLQA
jgi:hypothetical protein